ncbi:unnamed protein product [Adineta steineri]|uniref:Xanthine dehydrogenase n=1 Tax=Adineta steineri TaxID=433720 RepID=A0A813ZN41_9BILA|nr:unnamed protein product [Adineta steineri]CAF0929525.1 unnamed protein product [Adineta steineri]
MTIDVNDEKTNNYLTFYVNRKKIIEKNAEPHWTLVYYLRTKLNLTGTKIACGTGGCGSCTIVVSKYNSITKSITHFSVNSCLTLLCTLDGCHILTIEGLGCTHKSNGNLHPIQRTIAENYASQCGFCTPGMCMSLYDTLVNCSPQKQPTLQDIEDTFNGNLCRCTGYRPILDGAKKSFAEKEIIEEYAIDFPAELKEEYVPKAIHIKGTDIEFYQPLTLDHLFDLRKQYSNSDQFHFIAGNTGENFDNIVHQHSYPILIHLNQIPELQEIVEKSEGLQIGSCVALSRLKSNIGQSQEKQQVYKILSEQLEFNACRQIQNQATIGGHVLNHSRKHTSDLLPILYVCETKLRFIHLVNKKEIEIEIKNLNKTDRTDLLLISVFIPFVKTDEHLQSYKQAHRRKHDTGIVTGAFRLKLDANGKLIKLFNMAFGGFHDGVILVPENTMNYVNNGKLEWTQNNIMDNVKNELLKEVQLDQFSQNGQHEYRRTLMISFLFKFYLHVTNNAEQLFSKTRPISHGEQIFDASNQTKYVHQPLIHHNAYIHTTGEAKYVDDLPSQQNTLHGALVLSSKAHANILSINTEKAELIPGFVKFYSYHNIPPTGTNKHGLVIKDEEIFPSKVVHCMDMIIGLCVADTEEHARQAAVLVKIEYEELSPLILTIDEAIENESYLGPPGKQEKLLQIGDIDEGFKKSDHILEGTFYIGAQEHFYMEPNAYLVQPVSEGHYTQLHVYSTTQAMTQLQTAIAEVLGLNANEVTCHVTRVGGGFGGKESRNMIPCIAIALAAYELQLPVRLRLTREEDMKITGHRHPFKILYKVGFLKNGKLKSLDIRLFGNGGCSADSSLFMLERTMTHCDNIYKCENMRVRGRACRTNLPSNTAMRGFGAPEGLLAADIILDQISTYLQPNGDSSIIRELNIYKPGEKTYFNQTIEKKDWHVPEMWTKLKKTAEYEKRLKDVEEFNKKNEFRKRGLNMTGTKFGIGITSALFFHQAGALINIYKDGSVLITHGGVEIGQGLQVKMMQITAEQLDIDMSLVRLFETATDKIPNTTATVGSLSADIYGPALINACQQINKNLAPLKRKHPTLTWPKLCEQAYNDRIQLFASGFYSVPDKFIKNNFENSEVNFMYFTQGVGMSEVEIDCLTGDFHILRTDILMDFGKSLNPSIDIGQIEGAFMQGVGYLTMEELIQGDSQHPWISQQGSLHNADSNKYKIPMANDVPIDFRITLLSEHESSEHAVVYSSKAVGEPPLFLSATVYFAIKHAISAYRPGKESFTLNIPATCERIRMACKDQIIDSIIPDYKDKEFQPLGSF